MRLPAQSAIGLKACAALVETATHSCVQAAKAVNPAVTETTKTPDWDAIATGLSMQANAISIAAAVLGGLALVSAIGWAIFVRNSAMAEARKAAEEEVKKEAPAIIDAWLTTEGIAVLRQAAQMAQPTTTTDVADDIAKNAGEQ